MKKWLSNNKLNLLGVFTGAIAGFLYWKFVGCSNGKCMIKSNPYYMSIYGALLGGLLTNLFKK